MHELKISLIHGGLLSHECSVLFLKHIEGITSSPEQAIIDQTKINLAAIYEEKEKDEHIIIPTGGSLPFSYVYVINFHIDDLPFRYESVDHYARQIIRFAMSDERFTKVATSIHGPGAGLDASQAMETMLNAFASELHTRGDFGNLREILFIERKQEIFERLQERIKYLSTDKDLISIEGDGMFLKPVSSDTMHRSGQKKSDLSARPLFVAMPFKDEFDNIFYYGIKKPVEDLGRICERTDQSQFVGDIISRLKSRINVAELIIADITGNNPNVFYEVGYAEGLGKRVVLIAQEQHEIPFDLRTQRCICYRPEKIRDLEIQLRELLPVLLAGD